MMKPSKSSSSSSNRMTFKSSARLYLSASAAAAAALVVMMTLSASAANGRQLLFVSAEPNSKAPVEADELVASANRRSTSLLAAPQAGSETVEQTTSVIKQHKQTTIGADLHGDQSNIANAKVHLGAQDMTPAAAGHYGKSHGGGKYYMYAEVPKKGAYKMGFKRGNHKHMIERKESSHKGHVSSYFKWHAKKGKGSHKFEFKHYDKKGGKHYG